MRGATGQNPHARKTQDPVPKGFVGSNPTPRTIICGVSRVCPSAVDAFGFFEVAEKFGHCVDRKHNGNVPNLGSPDGPYSYDFQEKILRLRRIAAFTSVL
jgi:hypothetical protein